MFKKLLHIFSLEINFLSKLAGKCEYCGGKQQTCPVCGGQTPTEE